MAIMKKIDPATAKLNMMFSAPVFFDDGKYMFLAAGKSIKPYHLLALKKWNIPYLLTSGSPMEQSEGSNIERMAGFDKKRIEQVNQPQSDDDIEELEEI